MAVKVKYCLYARKSTESEERQVLSIDSQIKEMLQLADREGLEIVELKRESHSAKETGTRPVFNEIVEDLRAGKPARGAGGCHYLSTVFRAVFRQRLLV